MTNPKLAIFEQLAEVARVLGHAHRLDLLEHISQGERSVEALAKLTGLSLANSSQHLQQLRRAGFVASRRDGKHVLYRIGDGPVQPLLAALRAYGEVCRAEVRTIISDYFERVDTMEPVSRAVLLERLSAGEVMLLDVRPEDEFALGHLPGALNVPLSELEARLAELPADKEIVAYCRGPYCVLSVEAVAMLRSKGYRVRRLEDGLPEWKAAGLEVETTESATAIQQ
ncbi:ArsR/SmtB family transcription factor [Sphingopyxis sp. R3-92]|uniref:ArsR/SmtB family transcription factor n=1 Tax=Sphingopyxis sp. R3-92 TaxID=3158553 RepID=UPI003EE67D75